MAGLLEIYNTALYRVKETPLISTTDTSRAAVAVARSYDVQRPALLRRYRWQFALARTSLAPLATDPPFGWKKWFQLPADFLMAVSISPHEGTTKWTLTSDPGTFRIEGNRILADTDKVYLVYVKDETDPSKFDPLFVDTLAWAIASDLALALAADRELHATCVENMERSLLAARRAGSIEQNNEIVIMNSRVLDGRLAADWNPRWPEALS